MHTYIHTHIHTYIKHMCIHVYFFHTCTHACVPCCSLLYWCFCIGATTMCTYTYIHIYSNIFIMHTYIHIKIRLKSYVHSYIFFSYIRTYMCQTDSSLLFAVVVVPQLHLPTYTRTYIHHTYKPTHCQQ